MCVSYFSFSQILIKIQERFDNSERSINIFDEAETTVKWLLQDTVMPGFEAWTNQRRKQQAEGNNRMIL